MEGVIALDCVRTLQLSESRLVVAGAWNGDSAWIGRALTAAGRHSRTVLHLGDICLTRVGILDEIDAHARAAGITMVAVTPGDQDDWDSLRDLFAEAPGRAVRISETVWVLPPAFTFTAGGRSFMSLGGAAHPDLPVTTITDADADRAIRTGWVDVMLTHDTVAAPEDGDASVQRARVTRTYFAVGPTLLLHAHTQVPSSAGAAGGRRVFGLGGPAHPRGHLVTIDVDTLTVMQVHVPGRGVGAPVPADAALMWA